MNQKSSNLFDFFPIGAPGPKGLDGFPGEIGPRGPMGNKGGVGTEGYVKRNCYHFSFRPFWLESVGLEMKINEV